MRLVILTILAVSLSACATTPKTMSGLPMALVGPTDEWSGLLSEDGVRVSSSHDEVDAPSQHLSVSASMVMMNAEVGGTDYVSVLLTREPCSVNGRSHPYSAYFGHRRAVEGDYALRGCAEPVA